MAEFNFDEIPEQYRELFTEQDGRFTLNEDTVKSWRKNADDVRSALSARDNEKGEAAKLRKQIEEMQAKFGSIDPERLPEAMEALKRVEELEHKQLLDEKKFVEAAEQKYRRQLAEMERQIESLNKTVEEERTRYNDLFSDYGKTIINDRLSRAFIEAGIDPDFLDAAVQMEAQNWEVNPETRESIPFVLTGDKQRVTAYGTDGKPLTYEEHARTFLRDKPKWALQSNGSQSSHQGAPGNRQSRFSITRDEMRNDNRRYEKLREQADSAGERLQIVD